MDTKKNTVLSECIINKNRNQEVCVFTRQNVYKMWCVFSIIRTLAFGSTMRSGSVVRAAIVSVNGTTMWCGKWGCLPSSARIRSDVLAVAGLNVDGRPPASESSPFASDVSSNSGAAAATAALAVLLLTTVCCCDGHCCGCC